MIKKSLFISFLLIFITSSCAPAASTHSSTAVVNGTTPPTVYSSPTPTPTQAPETRLSTGQAEFNSGDYDKAIVDLTAAENSTDPEVIAEAMQLIGRISLQKQDYKTAVMQFGNLVNTQPQGNARDTAFFFLAQSYEGLQQYQLAADAYQNYLKFNANTPLKSDILVMMGDDLTSAGNIPAALSAYQTALPLAQPEYQDDVTIKVAQATAANGDSQTAITLYNDLYNSTQNNYTKSTVNLLLGRLYLQEGMADKAYERFQESVAQFPTSYDTYNQLVALVNDNQTVDDLLRGIVDYYAGQYGAAVSAFDRYTASNPKHDDTPLYYKALSLWEMGNYNGEVAEWDQLIQGYPAGTYYARAYLEKASTQWRYLHEYTTGAETLLTFVQKSPDSSEAPIYLYDAARIYEQGGYLTLAAQTWQSVMDQYPSYDQAVLAQFNAGICYYRMGNYAQAQVVFQRNALLTSNLSDKARAEMWVGKTLQKLDKKQDALSMFKQAAAENPGSYYSIRAGELLNNQAPFPPSSSFDLGVDLAKEKSDAAVWMHSKYNIPANVDLLSPGDLANNILYQRGDAFYQLGMISQAQSEFESLRTQFTKDAANSFRLMNHMLDLGINQTAILTARQILDILGLGDTSLMDQTPAYFQHVRFGAYDRDIIVPAAADNGLDPLLVFSVIRQESFFEPEITSSQGATGLMQILPAVGQEIAVDYGWPPDYTSTDLIRPLVNVKLGTHYLAKWDNYFSDITAALAAYNGGIGNAIIWEKLAGNDPDLLLEVIPDDYSETQDYIRFIAEDYLIYQNLYYRQ